MTESDPADPSRMLPLRPVDLQVLLVLAETEMHGYGVMKEVERESGGRVTLEVGSLYRVIGRLLDEGLIVETEPPESAESDGRERRFYTISPLGRSVVRAEVERLAGVVETAQSRV